MHFLDKVNHDSPTITPDDIAPLHAAGWSDEAIWYAITVCALFNFYNRWISATVAAPEARARPVRAQEATGRAPLPSAPVLARAWASLPLASCAPAAVQWAAARRKPDWERAVARFQDYSGRAAPAAPPSAPGWSAIDIRAVRS